jgi:hypothetical protein
MTIIMLSELFLVFQGQINAAVKIVADGQLLLFNGEALVEWTHAVTPNALQ